MMPQVDYCSTALFLLLPVSFHTCHTASTLSLYTTPTLEAMQTTQIFEYHNGISRSLNKYTAAFTESSKGGLCSGLLLLSGSSSNLWLDQQPAFKKAGFRGLLSLPRSARETFTYASLIPSLKQGVSLTCLSEPPLLKQKSPSLSDLHTTNGKRECLLS